MLGLTPTRRANAELAAQKAETDRQRNRAEKAEKDAATADFNRQQVLRQNAEQDATIRRLKGRNLALGEQISKLTEADPEYTADLERQLAAAREELAAEKKRGDHLQARLDDAVGLTPRGIQDSSPWQPGYEKPKAGAS